MLTTPKQLWSLLLVVLLLAGAIAAQDYEEDDEYDEPSARVARISQLKGEAQIKRIDTEEWEKVVANLPIVEGDTIQTNDDTRLEIELDRYSFLRLNENSVLKFTFLADDGIALSLSKGTLGVTLIRFENKDTYLEIDAPKSTVAIQKTGLYRIDAGDEYNKEVRVSVRDGGQARVYSSDSGFVLKNERTARLFLEGTFAGEWETSRNSSLVDDFDDWTMDRNRDIAALLVVYDDDNDDDDRYYDQAITGADDLDRYGDWVYIADYGNVWRPSRRSIATYLNWSPYRYGTWRWLPYYGWTWVNDEPWGWATSHYGRWVHHRGRWYWSPYGRHRRGRSFWRPALVYVAYIGNSICWYPLPYGYGYYDYNRRFRNRWPRRPGRHHGSNSGNGGGGGGNNTPTPNTVPQANIDRGQRTTTPPFMRVPATGVISVPADQFGKTRKGFQKPPLSVARKVLRQKPVVANSPPYIPDRTIGTEVKATTPRTKTYETKTGATTRRTIQRLDEKLRREKIFGNRTPAPRTSPTIPSTPRVVPQRPRTGVFDRKVESKERKTGPVTRRTTRTTPAPRTRRTERKTTPPVSKPRPRPTYVPRTKQPERKSSPPARRSSPPPRRSSPPTRRSSPPARKSSPPARSAPKRAAPKRSAPKKSAPKSKPKTSSRKTSSKTT